MLSKTNEKKSTWPAGEKVEFMWFSNGKKWKIPRFKELSVKKKYNLSIAVCWEKVESNKLKQRCKTEALPPFLYHPRGPRVEM